MNLSCELDLSTNRAPKLSAQVPHVMRAKSLPSCPTVCNPMGCSLPGSSVQGILQARILEWVAISFSRRSSWSRGQSCLSLCLLHWQADSLPLAPPGREPGGLQSIASQRVRHFALKWSCVHACMHRTQSYIFLISPVWKFGCSHEIPLNTALRCFTILSLLSKIQLS